ncbi:MAG: ATP-binding cassette domain-containing protein, partial [Candidatus Gastranaerophilales bacterium]|nr:ATP-binding cassette domain-containing protein [Candidatus Gastranaerophilales bacterium]
TYLNLISNSIIALILISYLFIKFTLCASIATIFVSALFVVEYLFLKKNSQYQNKYFSKTHNDFQVTYLKILDSIKEIKLSALQEKFSFDTYKKADRFAKISRRRGFWGTFHIYFTEISIMLTFIAVLISLFYSSNFNNQYLISSIATICVVVLRLAPTINRIQTSLYSLNSNKGITQDLLEFIDLFDDNVDFSITKEKMPFNYLVELKDVDFSYDKDKEGLKSINFKINKGDFIGIVGESGCYKTTLSLILAGLIKPQKGTITVDGTILNKSNYQKWQNNIALLSQDYKILFDKIEDISNKYFDKLNLENINSDINSLSYGQKQRLALANILTQDKSVLILDEISSSSDVISEEKINNILRSLKREKTIISIAHRLHILKHCDKIIYMSKGKIVDIDTFENLGKNYPEFKKIIELSNFSA